MSQIMMRRKQSEFLVNWRAKLSEPLQMSWAGLESLLHLASLSRGVPGNM